MEAASGLSVHDALIHGSKIALYPPRLVPHTSSTRGSIPSRGPIDMRDPVKRPTATRYAKGHTRAGSVNRGEKPAAPPSEKKQKTDTRAALARRELVAEKLASLTSLTLDWAQIREYTVATIQEALTDRQIRPENLSQPRLDIAVPAIEAMRYSGLKREFALLIASTMDLSRADDAHPAFIEILKQLTLDETRLLAVLPSPGQVIPMADLLHLDRVGRVKASLRHILPAAYAANCGRKPAIPGYVDNLTRLSLVSSPARYRIDEEKYYRDLMAQDFVVRHSATLPAQLKATVERSVLGLTDFGNQFRECCLDLSDAQDRVLRP